PAGKDRGCPRGPDRPGADHPRLAAFGRVEAALGRAGGRARAHGGIRTPGVSAVRSDPHSRPARRNRLAHRTRPTVTPSLARVGWLGERPTQRDPRWPASPPPARQRDDPDQVSPPLSERDPGYRAPSGGRALEQRDQRARRLRRSGRAARGHLFTEPGSDRAGLVPVLLGPGEPDRDPERL